MQEHTCYAAAHFLIKKKESIKVISKGRSKQSSLGMCRQSTHQSADSHNVSHKATASSCYTLASIYLNEDLDYDRQWCKHLTRANIACSWYSVVGYNGVII
jgi:hypothetical protein